QETGTSERTMFFSLGVLTGPPPLAFRRTGRSIAVELGLVRTVHGHAQVFRLLRGERLELHAELAEVEARHLLVELLRQDVHTEPHLVVPQRDLSEHLVRDARVHDDARVT